MSIRVLMSFHFSDIRFGANYIKIIFKRTKNVLMMAACCVVCDAFCLVLDCCFANQCLMIIIISRSPARISYTIICATEVISTQ